MQWEMFVRVVCLFLVALLAGFGQENSASTSGERVTFRGGNSGMRVALVKESENLIRETERLLGELGGTPVKVVVAIHDEVRGKGWGLRRELVNLEGVAGQYSWRADIRPGWGGGVNRDDLRRALLEMLLVERALSELPEEEVAEQVEIYPWLLDGVGEALKWKNGRGDRRVYASLMESGGWMDVEALLEKRKVGELDVLQRELFRASSGALVMALLSQVEGNSGLKEMVKEAAVFEGEQMSLLRKHFPGVNLGRDSLKRWWMLQVAAMSEKKVSQVMTIPETEKRLAKVLKFHLQLPSGKLRTVGINLWSEVASLETQEARLEAVRPALDQLAHLSYRSFPTYRPVIAGYVKVMGDVVQRDLDGVAASLLDLEEVRQAENSRFEKMEDLLDWYHLATVREESGQFDEFMRVQKEAQDSGVNGGDPFNEYLDRVQELFEAPGGKN